MRTATSLRLLLIPAALLATACEDASSPLEPPAWEDAPMLEAPPPREDAPQAVAEARWADGYLQLFVIGSLLAWSVLGWVLLERYTRSRTRRRE